MIKMKLLRWLDQNLEKYVITALTSVMTVALFCHVLFRFVLNLPLAWTDEVALTSLIWLCYFGCALATKNRANLKMEIITTFLNAKWKKIFEIISLILFFAFAVFATYWLLYLTLDIMRRGQKTAVLQWPLWIPYGGAGLGFVDILVRIIQDFIKCTRELKELKANGWKTPEVNTDAEA